MKKCCIKNCKSVYYEGCNITFFGAPKTPDKFLKWSSIVALTGSILYNSSFVCEKHFGDDVESEVTTKDKDGKILLIRPLRKKRLLNGSFPKYFPSDDNSYFYTIGANDLPQEDNNFANNEEDNSNINILNKASVYTYKSGPLPLQEIKVEPVIAEVIVDDRDYAKNRNDILTFMNSEENNIKSEIIMKMPIEANELYNSAGSSYVRKPKNDITLQNQVNSHNLIPATTKQEICNENVLYTCLDCEASGSQQINHCESQKYNKNANLQSNNNERLNKCVKCFADCKELKMENSDCDWEIKKSSLTHNDVKTDHKTCVLYSCSKCAKTFCNISDLNIHFGVHETQLLHSCATCKKTFPDINELVQHSAVHKMNEEVCCKCGISFTRFSDLMVHLKSEHQSDIDVHELNDLRLKRFARFSFSSSFNAY